MNKLVGFIAVVLIAPSAHATEFDLLDRLSSPNLAERREAARSLDVEKIGHLEPELAVRAVLMAAQDTDPTVRQWALGGLGILALAVRNPDMSASAALFAQAMPPPPELRALLERIINEDPSAEVVNAASAPYMVLFGSDPAAEALLLDRVDREPDTFERLRLLASLRIGGIDGEQTFDRLGRYLDGAPLPIQISAAHLLLSAKTLPRDRFEDFVRLIETPEGFADPKLISALPRFGVSADKYLPTLLVLQSRLREEMQRPEDERTLAIYNEAYWKQTLDEAIAGARSAGQ